MIADLKYSGNATDIRAVYNGCNVVKKSVETLTEERRKLEECQAHTF